MDRVTRITMRCDLKIAPAPEPASAASPRPPRTGRSKCAWPAREPRRPVASDHPCCTLAARAIPDLGFRWPEAPVPAHIENDGAKVPQQANLSHRPAQHCEMADRRRHEYRILAPGCPTC